MIDSYSTYKRQRCDHLQSTLKQWISELYGDKKLDYIIIVIIDMTARVLFLCFSYLQTFVQRWSLIIYNARTL